jgi:hypothetical protein
MPRLALNCPALNKNRGAAFFEVGSRNPMRLVKTIAWLTLVFWLIQSLTFIALFASWFTDLIVRFFITLGLPSPESALTAFLSGAMKILAWPARVIFSSTWSQAGSLTAILLLAVNSLIWGIVLGTIVFILTSNRRRSIVTNS